LKRVVVIGAPGSGKTTFSKLLAQAMPARYVELDAILHGEGGREPSAEEFQARVLPLLEREPWVVDGWHERHLQTLTFERADTIVFLDPPLWLTLLRVLRRSLGELVFHKELWNGNRQTLHGVFGGRQSLLGYAVYRHADLRRRVAELKQAQSFEAVEWVHARRSSEARAWVHAHCS
jgi:adenylate kinase family enzyme